MCGAQKKKFKRAKLEKAQKASIKEHNSTNKFLNLPRELRQNILHLTYNEETTRGLSQAMRYAGQCGRFAPLHDKLRQHALNKARNDPTQSRLLFEGLSVKEKIRSPCPRCFSWYVGEVTRYEKKLADWVDWVHALKLVHPGLVADVDFVAGKWREEFRHTLLTEKHFRK